MAHYISDLIVQAETVSGTPQDEVRHQAANAILGLWAHRTDLPVRHRPLKSFEPVFEALTRLSGPQSPWQFYKMFDANGEPTHIDTVGTPMLQFALDFEDTVREIVQQIIILAAAEASDKEAKWLQLSEHLIEDDERRARRTIRQLQRALRVQLDNSDVDQEFASDPDDEIGRLISVLRRAEDKLAGIRHALEGHFSDNGADVSTEHDDQT